MVSWSGDGHVSGFDYVSQRLSLVAPLAVAGCADGQWPTRIQSALDDAWANTIDAQATLTFTSGDMTATYAGAEMFVAPASAFPPGYTPLIADVMDPSKYIYKFRSTEFITAAGTATFRITGPGLGIIVPSTKYWVVVVPALSFDWPYGGPAAAVIATETNSRGTSVWTNRTPAAPAIISPVAGTVVNAGGSFTLSYTDADPDLLATATTGQRDCSGVQVQYRAKPTALNPSPTWVDLPIANESRNHMPNGGFDTGTTGWAAGAGTTSIAASGGIFPAGVCRVDPVDGGSQSFVNGPVVPVNPGQQYWFGGAVYGNGGTGADFPAFVMIRWYSDAGGTVQVGPDEVGVTINVPGVTPTPSWAEVFSFGTAPATAITARAFYCAQPTDPSHGFYSIEEWYLDNCYWNDAREVGLNDHGYWGHYEPSPTLPSQTDPGWWIDYGAGDRYPASGAIELWINKTIGVQCGTSTLVSGNGALPSGDWQLRMRTFDYGHPYPLDLPPLNSTPFSQSASSMPSQDTSPWSDTVNVSVLAEVPPPIPVKPINANALPAPTSIEFDWNYRNTHVPTPYAQASAVVQARKIGSPTWDTVGRATGTATTVTVPVAINPAHEYFVDGGFEGGTLDGWTVLPGGPPYGVLSLVHDVPPAVHSGSYAARVTDNGTYGGGVAIVKTFPIVGGHDDFTLTGWVLLTTTAPTTTYAVDLIWLDSGGSVIGSPVIYYLTGLAGWQQVYITAAPPVGAVSVDVTAAAVVAATNPVSLTVDDFSLKGRKLTDGYQFQMSTEYEWRVQATDTNASVSDWSNTSSARFWIVPAPASGGVLPAPGGTIAGATLGCGKHRVFVYRRGGATRVAELKFLTHVDWNRARDDIGTSQIVVSGWDIDCGNLLANLQTWAYEVVIFRDNGYSVDRVFEGPITLLTYEVDKVTIDAKDVMAYAYRRIMKQTMDDSGTGNGDTITSRSARILQNVFAPDDPNILAYLQVLARDDDAMEYRSTPAYSRTAFEEIDDMAANAGLDYVAVGRSILLWDTSHRIGTLPEFRDADLGSPPIVSEYGMSMANEYAVSDGNGVYGEATRLNSSGNDPVYGLVELLSSTWASDTSGDTGTLTQANLASTEQSFADSAERSIANRYPPPVTVRVPDNTSLSPDVPVSIQHLVPGVAIPLRSSGTLRKVFSVQKLDSMKVVEESGNETVTITMSPFGTDQTLADEETGGGL